MNGSFIRPFVYSAAPFAGLMIVVELLFAGATLEVAIVRAAIFGAMFGGAMGAMNASRWVRDWARRKTDFSLEEGESVHQSGFANLGEHGGILYVTDRHLRFTSHPFNYGTTDWVVALPDIESMDRMRTVGGLVPNGIRLTTASGDERLLTTWERDEWYNVLQERL
ncbi:MAG: hypothetical protein BRD55_08710 [Bacteroidetes bacterium SW_9_63_38]|nr:MAG: hypothetical protein BRD55_08710 [Bacteroidetes bacterium SW_9_63_38]